MNWAAVNWFALGAGVLYVAASIKSGASSNVPMSGMWLAYAIANAFLVWAEYKGSN